MSSFDSLLGAARAGYPGQMNRAPQPASQDLRTFGAFALASAGTIALGSAGLVLDGAGPGTWLRNPAAWFVGLALAAAVMANGGSASVSRGVIALAIAALAATFLAPPQAGVHRWIDAGPLRGNVAALLLPSVLVALATSRLPAPPFMGLTAVIGLLLAAQPDASQASAFLTAASLLLISRPCSSGLKVAGTLGAAALVAAAWLRPDRLQPVPEAEGIFGVLAGISSVLAAAAAIALAVTSLVPLRAAPGTDRSRGDAALALTLYFGVVGLMPLLGAFPVPLVGLGMSFPVGYLLGMALLCARRR